MSGFNDVIDFYILVCGRNRFLTEEGNDKDEWGDFCELVFEYDKRAQNPHKHCFAVFMDSPDLFVDFELYETGLVQMCIAYIDCHAHDYIGPRKKTLK
ncbi:hypothetical protein AKO1_009717 [Acrasis kona]|uniref:Uncharacterized protein n=1 Tax=Acrasis kona TaxID=1008807 RepID=A0AAW2ZMK7_9EUKA